MNKLLLQSFLLMAFLTSCTLFSKSGGGDMQNMVSEVLDEDQGFVIRIEPLPELD